MTDEQIRKANEALALLTGVLTIAMLTRLMLGNDAIVRLRMHVLRDASRSAKQGAEVLSAFAARCDTSYHRMRNVTV